MSQALPSRSLVHRRTVTAPASELYGLIADVRRWPVIFEPCVHVRHLEQTARSERFQLWALVNGQISTWVSRRVLDPIALRVDFRQERSSPPVASMEGRWEFHRLPEGRTEIVLRHDFAVLGGDEDLDAITRAVDRNSESELAAVARLAEQPHPIGDLVFGFTDSLDLTTAPDDAYAFLERSDRWPQWLPHVHRVDLREQPGGVQEMEMETVTRDGGRHVTRSIRLCTPPRLIVYKQLVRPRLLLGHSGSWEVGGGTVTARHTVAIDVAALVEALGAGATLQDGQAHLREVLGANSRGTLSVATAVRPGRVGVS
ncbi:cyclase [Modestobacter sp. I12A-02628]|uniref:Cyclase n=1 Tax=Goekera deserti TaxID=2497753 RepID=A0A7K3WDN0_9ACTN|nr:SRPBCC family protein [Goekera deserti]MPQ97201.1 cyclase [Goekera deserti]NDI46481.1 cyclase [Goekera deserti]NEL54585.1 cyclase [Goekera deserti]